MVSMGERLREGCDRKEFWFPISLAENESIGSYEAANARFGVHIPTVAQCPCRRKHASISMQFVSSVNFPDLTLRILFGASSRSKSSRLPLGIDWEEEGCAQTCSGAHGVGLSAHRKFPTAHRTRRWQVVCCQPPSCLHTAGTVWFRLDCGPRHLVLICQESP